MKKILSGAMAIMSIVLALPSYATNTTNAAAASATDASVDPTIVDIHAAATAANTDTVTNADHGGVTVTYELRPINEGAIANPFVIPSPSAAITAKINDTKTKATSCLQDPVTCAQNPQTLIDSVKGLPQAALNGLTTYANQQLQSLTQAGIGIISNVIQQNFPFLSGLFGSSNVSPTTKSQIDANSTNNVEKATAQADTNSRAAELAKAQGIISGTDTTGIDDTVTHQNSEIIAGSVLGKDGIQHSHVISAASSKVVRDAATEANKDPDNSLDAIKSSNIIEAKKAAQADLSIGLTMDQMKLQAQQLKESAEANRLAEAERNSNFGGSMYVAKNNVTASGYIDSITRIRKAP
jgi:hypothetical protein